MGKRRAALKKILWIGLIAVVMTVVWLPRALEHTPSAAMPPFKVHIAFGFHVNLYHSFRGDTNDENGFGQDIDVIRHTLSELERFNRGGIPVKAVWDFDNLFSLEEILPVHAPDIISDVRRRIEKNGDEAILMSYNNGLASAMNNEEFMASVQRAIANEKGSGVKDIFGSVAPIVRPQEMMTTPGHFKRYRESGIEYVSLYYSATPFDAFRLFSRKLTPAEAHNPIEYRNPTTGERIGIIPTYHAGDLVEHVSLRNWVQELHDLQREGKIDRDVLVFINFDADAEFWTGKPLPWHLRWLPNTGGIAQLVESVADLDWVRFTNLTDYLADHPPAGTVYFGQDTADGSFNGYDSWAEKASASDYWTRIVRNRRAHRMARRVCALSPEKDLPAGLRDLLQASFDLRLRALSTTNFGLATPFLVKERETAMAALLDRLDDFSEKIEAFIAKRSATLVRRVRPSRQVLHAGRLVDTFVHLNDEAGDIQTGDRHLTVALPGTPAEGDRYILVDEKGRSIPAAVVKRRQSQCCTSLTLRVSKDHEMPDGVYFLCCRESRSRDAKKAEGQAFADATLLKNRFMAVHFDANGHPFRVDKEGAAQLGADSLIPYIVYRGKRITPERLTVTVEKPGDDGMAVVRLHGPWAGPAGMTRAPGWVDTRLRLLAGVPYLFVESTVRYPDTWRNQVIQADKPMLARKIDAGWQEVAPVELRYVQRASRKHPFFIHKRNYLGEEGAYAVDYYRHSSKNRSVASINNHITAEYAAVTTSGSGMAVAMNPNVSANFAYCPFKMDYRPQTDEFAIRANPFGTYHGSQIIPPTRGNRQGYEAVVLSAPQLHSAGPTYNGRLERFELMVAFFNGDAVPNDVKADLVAFARGPMTIGTIAAQAPRPPRGRSLPPAGFMALPYRDGVLLKWEADEAPGTQYRIRCRNVATLEERVFVSVGDSLFLDRLALDVAGHDFLATVESFRGDSGPMKRTRPIRFGFSPAVAPDIAIPLDFKAKLLWANVNAWIRWHLLQV